MPIETLPVADHPDTPNRMYMEDPEIEWRTVKPNYSVVNAKYLAERTKFHKADSLEKLVENLVKTWEMESTHKIKVKVGWILHRLILHSLINCNFKDWGTVDPERYIFRTNGGAPKDLENNIQNGNYNMMMDNSPLFDVSKETNASSHALFKECFPDGFAWELLDLLSGKPHS